MRKGKHTSPTKKQIGRLERTAHVGGPRSKKSSRKMLERGQRNLEIVARLLNN